MQKEQLQLEATTWVMIVSLQGYTYTQQSIYATALLLRNRVSKA